MWCQRLDRCLQVWFVSAGKPSAAAELRERSERYHLTVPLGPARPDPLWGRTTLRTVDQRHDRDKNDTKSVLFITNQTPTHPVQKNRVQNLHRSSWHKVRTATPFWSSRTTWVSLELEWSSPESFCKPFVRVFILLPKSNWRCQFGCPCWLNWFWSGSAEPWRTNWVKPIKTWI